MQNETYDNNKPTARWFFIYLFIVNIKTYKKKSPSHISLCWIEAGDGTWRNAEQTYKPLRRQSWVALSTHFAASFIFPTKS